MAEFNNEHYWSNRLETDLDLSTIGYKGLGLKYNEWLYRKRIKILKRVFNEYFSVESNMGVVEFGVGSGFYIKFWKDMGIKNYLGLDITTRAVNSLTKKYSEYKFKQADISSEEFEIENKYNIVTAFDVLFNIVEDSKFETAIKNISKILDNKNIILISDVIYDNKKFYGIPFEHFKPRNLDYYRSVLEKKDLKLVKIINVFSFMHPRSVFPKKMYIRIFYKAFNKILILVLKTFPSTGWLLGPAFYAIDCLLDYFKVDGHSVKLMVVKKYK